MKPNKLFQLFLKRKKQMYSRAFSVDSFDAECVSLVGMPVGGSLLNLEGWHIVMDGAQTWLVSNEQTQDELYDIQLQYHVNGRNEINFSTSFNFIGTIPHRPK